MDSKTLKKLLKVVVLTVIISYALDKVAFYGLNKLSDKVMTGQAIGKLNQFLSVKDSVDIIVFGNSRANHHIDIDLLGKSGYNIGMDGSGIGNSSTLINSLSKNKEQLVIVHIDTKNFFDQDYKGSDIGGLKTKFKRNTIITKALRESNQISYLQNIYHSINYNGKAIGIIKNFFRPSYNHKNYNGYDPLIVPENKKAMRDIVLTQGEDENCESLKTLNPLALGYLNSIKKYSEDSKKAFLFITSPILNDLCDKDNAILGKTIRNLGFTYLDSSNMFKNKNDNDLWKDRTHMSDKGAKTYTSMLLNTFKKELN